MNRKPPAHSWPLFALVLAIVACSSAADEQASSEIVVGVSPFFAPADRDAVKKTVYHLLLETVPVGTRITLFDAFNLKRITDLNIPDRPEYRPARVRAHLAKSSLAAINRFFAERLALAGGEEGPSGGIRLPQFLDFLANFRQQPKLTAIIVLGSPLYIDPRDREFSMSDGLMPTDGHLCVSQTRSVFGTTNRRGPLAGVPLHYGYLPNPWLNDFHEYRARQFWSLYVREVGGRLVTFTGDLPTLLEQTKAPVLHPLESLTLDCQQPGKIGMVSVMKSDWGDPRFPLSRGIPCATKEKMSIGLLWKCSECDLDLYSRPAGAAKDLYYGNPYTDFGIHYKDFKTLPNPAYGFEWVEYQRPVTLAELKTAVNFYGGRSPEKVRGEIRVKIGDKAYGGEFTLEAQSGNQGTDGDRREKSNYWRILDLEKLLGCVATAPATATIRPRAQRPEPERPSGSPRPRSGIRGGRGTEANNSKVVRIHSPGNGEVLESPQGRTVIFEHPVTGDVLGYDQHEILALGLQVDVRIETNQEYPQGIALVSPDGRWVLPTAYFGGSRHIVKAMLMDRNGNVLGSTEVTVNLIHR